MDIALRKEYESRMERTRAEAAKRGYEALIIIGMSNISVSASGVSS